MRKQKATLAVTPPAPETSPQPTGGGGPQLDLRSMFGILRRRKFLILGIALLITSGALLFAGQLTPLYRAQTELLIMPNRTQLVDIPDVVKGIQGDWLTNQTEAAIIASREMAKRAVLHLDLQDSPLYNPTLRPRKPDFFEGLLRSAQTALSELGIGEGPEPLRPRAPGTTPDPRENEEFLAYLADSYLGGLAVIPEERSRIIRIVYVSTDREMAALAANTTAELYIESLRQSRAEGTGQAAEFLQRQVEESQTKLINAQRALEQFRQDRGLQEIEGVSLTASQLRNLENQLLEATTLRQEAEARYNQIRRLQGDREALASAAGVLGSTLVQNLLLQEVQLNRRIAELATQYRDKHPKMMNAHAELENLQARIVSEIDKVVASLRNELEVARVRESNLRTEIGRLRGELEQANDANAEKRALQTEVEINKELYETLLQRLREVDVQEQAPQETEARILNSANVPGGAFYPRKRMIVGMAFAASLVLGIALALVLELMDSGFRSLSQIESQTGLPTLGMLPELRLGKKESPHMYATDRQGSLFAESVRTLRTGLMLMSGEAPPKVVIVTSSVPDEGKTSTVLSIGAQNMQAGRRCITVDCDMRHPSLSTALGYGPHLGLGDYLAGEAEIPDIIAMDEHTGLHFISAGTGRVRPIELLSSPRMQRLLQELSNNYQLVLLDTPPVLAVSDALPLLRDADATIFLIRWEKTARDTAKAGLKVMLEVGAKLAGIVLTYVDVRKHAQYDYADSGYYYHKSYRKYYAP